jgi:LacI family transcriptional regulator
MKQKVTIKTIAQYAGVSVGTVDRALNNRGRISLETQNKIIQTANDLGYKPNTLASVLASSRLKKIIAVLPASPAYFFDEIQKGMEDAAKELQDYKITVKYLHPDKLNPISQIDVIKTIKKENADGIVMNPAHSMLNSYINDFSDSGIPVITFNSDVEKSKRLFYIGQDMKKAGELAGELMGKFLRGEGRVIILNAYSNVESLELRKMGFIQALNEDYGDVVIDGTYEYAEDEENAYLITKKLLEEDDGIRGVFVNSAAGTVGSAKAIEKLDLTDPPVLIGFDAVEYTRKMLKQGIVTAAICQDPYAQGYYSIKLMAKHLMEGWLPEREFLYTRLNITMKYNLDEEEMVNIGIKF